MTFDENENNVVVFKKRKNFIQMLNVLIQRKKINNNIVYINQYKLSKYDDNKFFI